MTRFNKYRLKKVVLKNNSVSVILKKMEKMFPNESLTEIVTSAIKRDPEVFGKLIGAE